MSLDTDRIKQDKLYNIYKSLVESKTTKLNMMYTVRRYLKPLISDFLIRFDSSASSERLMTRGLFDNTAMNKMYKYSVSSLSDIINPFVKWFSFKIRSGVKFEDEEELRKWVIEARDAVLDFIAEGKYYKSLLSDKVNYDLYGFSGMTITTNRKNKGYKSKAENPFKVLIYDDDEGVTGVMWEQEFTAFHMKLNFNWTPEEGEGEEQSLYKVVCACFPNDPKFINNHEKGGEYVQIFFLKEKRLLQDKDDSSNSQDYDIDDFEGIEIGERKYFEDLMTCVAVDVESDQSSYGDGWGFRILMPAANLNMMHRNILKNIEFVGNPPFQAPPDLENRFRGIVPGRLYGHSFTGNKIEAITFDGKLGDQTGILELERAHVDDTIPAIGPPPQKRQRQSQLEVQKGLTEAAKNAFVYKLNYLQEGVACHLDRFFDIAMKQGVIPELPKGLKKEDVKPSLGNLILKEFKKVKAMAYVEGLNMSYGYISQYPEGFDNFKVDYIIRGIQEAKGAEDGLEDFETVKAIRKIRVKRQQQEQAQALELQEAQRSLLGAQASKFGAEAETAKARAKSENLKGDI